MARPPLITPITPRLVSQKDLAAYLGKSASWLSMHLNELQAEKGFPKPHPDLKGYDLKAVDAWIDTDSRRSKGKRVMNAFN
jgi:biotin operon repressor